METGVEDRTKSIGIGAVTGLLNGLLGSGGGTLLVPAMERFLGVREHEAHATAIAVIAPLCIVSAVLYASSVRPDIRTLLMVGLGGIVGGIVGARLLGRFSGRVLHVLFGLSMIASGIRMVL